MKKISFQEKPSSQLRMNADHYVKTGEVSFKEPTKRLTIDVPVSLHKRIKSECVLHDQIMADMIREMLRQRFGGQGEAS